MNLSNIKTVVISADISSTAAESIVKQLMLSDLYFVRMMDHNEQYPADMDLLIMSNSEYHTYQDQVEMLPYECVPAYLAKSTIKEIIQSQKGNKTMSIINSIRNAANYVADVNVLSAEITTNTAASKGVLGVAILAAAAVADRAMTTASVKLLNKYGFKRTAKVVNAYSYVSTVYAAGLVGVAAAKLLEKK